MLLLWSWYSVLLLLLLLETCQITQCNKICWVWGRIVATGMHYWKASKFPRSVHSSVRSMEAPPCDLWDLKDLLLTSWQHKPDCRRPLKRQQVWQDLFHGRFTFLVNHTRKYMKNLSVSRVQSASKWFKTFCVKGNVQHIPLAACSSPFPRCTSSLRHLLMESV